MNKKIVKIICSIILMVMLVTMVSNVAFAAPGFEPKELTGEAINSGEAKNLGNKIVGMIQTVGVIIAVVIVLVLGIKYMMGSASEKAEYKKTMIPYLVGAVLLFAGATIVNVIYQVVTGL